MRFSTEVLEYIVEQKEKHGVSFVTLAKMLLLPFDSVMNLYYYQASLNSGNLKIVNEAPIAPKDQFTLEDCFAGRASKVIGNMRIPWSKGNAVKPPREVGKQPYSESADIDNELASLGKELDEFGLSTDESDLESDELAPVLVTELESELEPDDLDAESEFDSESEPETELNVRPVKRESGGSGRKGKRTSDEKVSTDKSVLDSDDSTVNPAVDRDGSTYESTLVVEKEADTMVDNSLDLPTVPISTTIYLPPPQEHQKSEPESAPSEPELLKTEPEPAQIEPTQTEPKSVSEVHAVITGEAQESSVTKVIVIPPTKRAADRVQVDEALILRLYEEGNSLSAITAKTFITPALVTRVLEKKGITPRKTKHIVSKVDAPTVKQRLDAGESKVKISFDMGYTPDILDDFVKRENGESTRVSKKERAAKQEAVIEAYKSGLSVMVVAAQTDLTQHTVKKILKDAGVFRGPDYGKTWGTAGKSSNQSTETEPSQSLFNGNKSSVSDVESGKENTSSLLPFSKNKNSVSIDELTAENARLHEQVAQLTTSLTECKHKLTVESKQRSIILKDLCRISMNISKEAFTLLDELEAGLVEFGDSPPPPILADAALS